MKHQGLDHLAIATYVVFPGNVGGPDALREAYRILSL